MCKLADKCLDLSWTKNVPPELYADKYHFNEPVYRVMGEQLLNLINEHHPRDWNLHYSVIFS